MHNWFQLKINMFCLWQVFKHMDISDGENEVTSHIKTFESFLSYSIGKKFHLK
jgi:hypothetical protein